jgi:hypothetical protein
MSKPRRVLSDQEAALMLERASRALSRSVEPTQESWIPQISEVLRKGFCTEGSYSDFAHEDVLRWQIFGQRGPWQVPRSFVIREEGLVVAHMGISTTAFIRPGKAQEEVPAVHITDWLNEAGESLGALLMLRSYSLAPVQYAFGSSPSGAPVLISGGFDEMGSVPLYHRVLTRHRSGVWLALHGLNTVARQTAYFAFDFAQSLRPAADPGSVQIERVKKFADEPDRVIDRCTHAFTCSSRSSGLLNHLLDFPKQNIFGYVLKTQGRICGFALLGVIEKPALRHGRIVECFLDSPDANLWRGSISALFREVAKLKADLVSCYASTPWIKAGLLSNGFFRRGRTTFYLRDPQNRLSRQDPFHLTHLEADLAYI